jgi:hypothetical protein
MPAADVGFKIAARISGRQLADVAGVPCDSWAPVVSEVQTTERLADRVFQARRGKQRFLVYMEAYARWKSAAPWSVLAKSGMLSERERLPTVSLVYILRPTGYRAQGGQFRLAVEEVTTQHVFFREICLWQQEPQPWWEQVPGLMALAPLCRQQRSPQEVLTHAAQAIADKTPDSIQRADLLTTLSIFGKMAYPDFDVAGLIGREQMKESKIIEEFQEEARVETRRQDILECLRVHFAPAAAREFAPALKSINDSDELGRLLRLALRCSALEQFRRHVQKVQSRQIQKH